MQLKSKTELETNRYELVGAIDAETFAEANTKAYKKGAAKMTIPGFRKGHAPRSIIEKMYGKEVFYEDALNILYPDAVKAILDQSELDLAGDRPEFELVSIGDEGVEFKLKVTVKPQVTLDIYKGIKAERPSVAVSDEEVDAEIGRLQERNARVITVEGRAAQMGDTAVIDFEGFLDGTPFDGGKGESYPLELGAGQFIPGFEEQVVGHNAEDEFDVNVTFPEEYHAEELAGKPVVFKCKLHEIKGKELPVLDDEFAKDVSEFDTLDELKKDLREKLEHQKQHSADDAVEKQLIDAVIEGFHAEIPACMIELRIDESVREFDARLRSQHLDLKGYLQYTGMTIEAMRESMREGAERQVKLRLALETIAKLEKLDVTDEEVQKQYDNYVEMYKVGMEQVKAAIPEKEVRDDIACNKAIDLIKDSAEVTEAKEGDKPAAKKPAAKKSTDTAKKPAAKKAAAKKDDAETKSEEKPAAKKPAAKKAPAKKAAEKPADAE